MCGTEKTMDTNARVISCKFSSWRRNVGLVWTEEMFDPLQWRIYASRNHGVHTGKQDG